MITKRDQILTDLFLFLAITTTLIVLGILFVYSSSFVYASELQGNSHYFLKKHLIGVILGVLGGCFFQWIPLSLLYKSASFFLGCSIILTSATLIPSLSRQIHGASRWVTIGLSFQPSELLKVALILWLANILAQPSKKIFSFAVLGKIVTILTIISVVLLKQPDFGMTITLWMATLTLFFIAYGHTYFILGSFLAFIPCIIIMITRYPYRLQRILTFLNPWNDPHGSGFQIIQSLIALGSGGFFGTGVAHSKQKLFYLPMQHTDFIFSIIAEETGFLGSFFVCTLLVLFLYFGIKLAFFMREKRDVFIIVGYTVLISFQAITNIAVCTGLVPTKGIGLPFVSYGNTSLVCSILMIAIITHIIRDQKGAF